jgi:hypothetical protein
LYAENCELRRGIFTAFTAGFFGAARAAGIAACTDVVEVRGGFAGPATDDDVAVRGDRGGIR